jgi:hypothetical protein
MPARRATSVTSVAAAADFHLWRVLARAGLGDAEAADLAARLVELA